MNGWRVLIEIIFAPQKADFWISKHEVIDSAE